MDKNSTHSVLLHPIFIPLKHSKMVYCIILFMHIIAVLVLFVSSLSIPKWPLWILLSLNAAWYWRIYRFNLFPLESSAILLNANDEWFVINKHNQKLLAKERPYSFVHPWLVVLLLRCQNKNLSIILTRDNVHEDMLRRIRVRLRFPVKTSNDIDDHDRKFR